MDRIVDSYLRSDPGRKFSSNFPIRPFVDNATVLAYDEPREWRFTTIGDLAKPTEAIGYLYDKPAGLDFQDITSTKRRSSAIPSGGMAISLIPEKCSKLPGYNTSTINSQLIYEGKIPHIVFCGVACLQESFQIDVFVFGSWNLDPDTARNENYIGRGTRLGMGIGRGEKGGIRNSQRCKKYPITRILAAKHVASKLKDTAAILQVVREINTGRRLEEREWRQMPGFPGQILWLSEDVNPEPRLSPSNQAE